MHETLLAPTLHRGKKTDAKGVQGGSDPKNFLGGWKPKKWGRSRPFQSFFHGDFPRIAFCISFVLNKLAPPQVDESGEGAGV